MSGLRKVLMSTFVAALVLAALAAAAVAPYYWGP